MTAINEYIKIINIPKSIKFESENKSIGLRNVYQRLKIYHGDEVEFIIDSEAYEKIISLHNKGFMVGLDDYSNSSASLSYLADLNVDIIKLSESLLDRIDNDQEFTRMMHVYKFIVNIAKQFNITVVSDGINSDQNSKLVRELDVHIGLGEFYSKHPVYSLKASDLKQLAAKTILKNGLFWIVKIFGQITI